MNSKLGTQVAHLAGRSVMRTLRQPAALIFPLAFPMILLAVNAAGLDSAASIPGFPADSYLDFALAVPFMQGALFSAMNAGQDIARDIETGFLSRLSLTPVRGIALLTGQLAGAVTVGAAQAVVYLLVGLIAGVTVQAGIAGALLILVFAMLFCLGFGSLGAFMALRTGSGEAVQGLFPLLFVLLFLSSAFLPRDLIEADWFRTIAGANPVSYLIEAVRSLIVSGWDPETLVLGMAITLGIIALALGAASLALQTRLERT